MKILIATTSLPHSQSHGAEICTTNFLDGCAQTGAETHVLGYLRIGDTPTDRPNYHSAGEWPTELSTANGKAVGWALNSILTNQPFTNIKHRSTQFKKALARLLTDLTPDMLIIDHAHMGWVKDLPNLPKKRVFLAHNCEHLLYSQMAEAPGLRSWMLRREAGMLKRLEQDLITWADQTWCLSETDRSQLSTLAPDRDIRVFHLPGQQFDPDVISAAPAPNREIGLIGSWVWEVNRRGLKWFLEEVAPLLPGHHIHIAGNGSEGLPTPPNVTFEGFVPDLARFLTDFKVIVIPTTAGSGVQLKTIETLSTGTPIVGTTLAFRGIELSNSHITIADSAQDMARAITQTLAAAPPDRTEGLTWAQARRATFQSQIETALGGL